MRFIPNSRIARVGVVVAVTTTLALSGAAAATATSKNTYTPAQVHVCYSPTAGTMKLVQPATKCKRGEKRLIWDRVAKTGATGARGLPGIQGPVGDDGVKGDTGADGAKGNTGADGATGPRGFQGEQGIAGGDGTNGIDGASAYYLATHLEVDPFVGTPEAWIASLKGNPGLDGEDGGQGIQGLPGTDGQAGGQGIQGIPGEPGTQGIQGIQGIPGTNGTNGTNGTDGTNGTNGTNGGSVLSSVVGSISAGNTAYAGPGLFSNSGSATSAAISAPVPFAGTLKNLQVVAGTSSRTLTVTVYKNDAVTTMTCNAGNAIVTCSDSAHPITFAAGDTLSYKIDVSNGTGSRANIRVSTLLQ